MTDEVGCVTAGIAGLRSIQSDAVRRLSLSDSDDAGGYVGGRADGRHSPLCEGVDAAR